MEVLIIKCSICNKDACFSIPHYRTAKTRIIDSYEYRCAEHIKLGKKIDRKLTTAKRKGNLYKEIEKLFPKPVVISKPTVIISEPTDKISEPSAK